MIIDLNGCSVIISNNNQKTIRVNSDIAINRILDLSEEGNWCVETAARCVSVSFKNSSFFFLHQAIPNLVIRSDIVYDDIVYIVPLNIQQSVYSFTELEKLVWLGINKYYLGLSIKEMNLTEQDPFINYLKIGFIKNVIDTSLNVKNGLIVTDDEDGDIVLNFCKLICAASTTLNLLVFLIEEPKKQLEFIKEVFKHDTDDIRLGEVISSDTHLSEVISVYKLLFPSDVSDGDQVDNLYFNNILGGIDLAIDLTHDDTF